MPSWFFSRLSLLHLSIIAYFAYLPWSVITKVFLSDKLGIPLIGLIREGLLLLVLLALLLEYIRKNRLPKFDLTDALIGAYIVVGIVVSLVMQAPLHGAIAGARYDHEFLLVYSIFRHAGAFLPWTVTQYLKVALWWIGSAFVAGLLVRFVFGEPILLHFGFSPYLSQWSFSEGVPIYHGVMGAGVRRFQGIWDGPNPAAIAIVVFIALLLALYARSKQYSFFAWIAVFVSAMILLLTYSRSSILAVILGAIVVSIFFTKSLLGRYRAIFISVVVGALLLGVAFFFRYEGTLPQIVQRDGSSKGHSQRFIQGLENFSYRPMGHGLGYAGPAYRYSIGRTKFDALPESEKDKLEFQRIPESWYIQVLEESGFIGLILFVWILASIFFKILFRQPMLAWALAVLSIMSVVLHTFESLYVSCFLFAIIGLVVGKTGLPVIPAPDGTRG